MKSRQLAAWAAPVVFGLAAPSRAQDTSAVVQRMPPPEHLRSSHSETSRANTSEDQVWGDADGDGLEDLYAIHPVAEDRLFRNLGNGLFEDVTEEARLTGKFGTRRALWEDFDQDGAQDLLLLTNGGSLHLHRGLGNGTFRDATVELGLADVPAVTHVEWLDYDRDGWRDLGVRTSARRPAFLHSLRGVSFAWIELSLPSGTKTSEHPVPARPAGSRGPRPLETGPGPAADEVNGLRHRERVMSEERRAANHREVTSEDRRTSKSGRVAVGEPAPAGVAKAELLCTQSIEDQATGSCSLQASSTATLGQLYPLSKDLFVDAINGHVGLGTTAPGRPLTVVRRSGATTAAVRLSDEDDSNNRYDLRVETGPHRLALTDGVADVALTTWERSGDRNVGIGTETPSTRLNVRDDERNHQLKVEGDRPAPGYVRSELSNLNGAAPDLRWDRIVYGSGIAQDEFENVDGYAVYFNGTGGEALRIKNTGEVGVGTPFPSDTLHVEGTMRLTGANGVQFFMTPPSPSHYRWRIAAQQDVGSALEFGASATPGGESYDDKMVILHDGRVGIGTSAPSAGSKLTVAGTTVTEILTITGGSDIAEPFEFSDGEVEPGMVASIDPHRPGVLRVADSAYDRTVVGIVSGAGGVRPGMTLSQEGVLEGEHEVALSGRVYCWADASSGPIQPGDLLTTSSTPGHAMRVADLGRAMGAILGKAVTALPEGRGLVLVVVALQ